MPNPNTPFFPAWRSRLAPCGPRLEAAVQSVKACTLARLEERFGSLLPHDLLTTAPRRRDRLYSTRRTFWCFLWQILTPRTSCREVVRQFQALLTLSGGPSICPKDGAYCQARARLGLDLCQKVLAATAQAAQKAAPAPRENFLQNRPLKAADTTTLTMPDTPANRATFPLTQATTDGIGFPMMRVVTFFCLASGAVLSVMTGSFKVAELRLWQQMLSQLSSKDILIGDSGFGSFVALSLLQRMGVDFIGRSQRQIDGRNRRQSLAPQDWILRWGKPGKRSAILSVAQWAWVPAFLDVRAVRGSLWRPGFRVREHIVITTLLDPDLYPAEQILQAYAQRWRLELCFNDLKTTLGLDMLSCKTPAMIQKELLLHLIAHNLVRVVAAQAATTHAVCLERISFKGTLDGLRQFALAMTQARSKKARTRLWDELLHTLTIDLVPDRPGRREPRAVKRQRNKYPRLDRDRRKFRDHPKRNDRRARNKHRPALLLN